MDAVCTLIKETVTGRDKYGNPIVEKCEREVFCQAFGITRSEFYAAAVADLQPELTIRLSEADDYEGEDTVEYEGVRYSVIRTYRDSGSFHRGGGMPLNAIELVVGRTIGDGKK